MEGGSLSECSVFVSRCTTDTYTHKETRMEYTPELISAEKAAVRTCECHARSR